MLRREEGGAAEEEELLYGVVFDVGVRIAVVAEGAEKAVEMGRQTEGPLEGPIPFFR